MAVAYLDKLNEQQRKAVEHGVGLADGHTAGPLLIIAGAGSGKTNTLAHRVAHLIVNGADPRRILLMTFSRRAASEMARRVERICKQVIGANAGVLTDALAWSGTFHGIGARLLRIYAEQIGLDVDFTIHDREDSADLMNLARYELGFSKTESRFPTKGTCLAIYSRAVNSQTPLKQILRQHYPWVSNWEDQLKQLFAAYVEAKQAQNVLDYDDLLLYWAQMVSDPDLAGDIGNRFDHVMVDEYQDTNRLQAAVLMALKPGGRGLTVVGDDAQSIYSFRAATVRNILDFPASFSPAADIITLDRNYRSTQPILAAANGVIDLARERFTKNLWTERQSLERPKLVTVKSETEQANFIIDQVLANRETGMTLKQQAVLFRTSSHSGPLEVELTRRNIPFVKFGGLKFLDSAHVKDMLAVLRFAQNPRDRVAGFRLLQMLPGIGPKKAGNILDTIAADPEPLLSLAEIPPPPKTGDDWVSFVQLLANMRKSHGGWPSDIEQARLWYEPHLERLHEDAETRKADLLQLEQIAGGYPSRERFLTELTLDPPDATSDQAGVPLLDEDYLTLSTIHSAKGQEWRSVFILNVVDGCIPSDLGVGSTHEIEEERRLLYVAMTRAKDSLSLITPQRFFTHGQNAQGDRHVYAARTRFIPATLLQFFETATWPLVSAAASERSAQQIPHRRRRADARNVEIGKIVQAGTMDNTAVRKVIHIDMDAFYASVEQRDNPALRGLPVAVGGSAARGVVAAASYEARTFGVHSAMPSVTAKRKCPDLIFVPPRFEVYRQVSQQIREIFAEYTPLIEPLSLDEAYLDVTENLKGMEIATEIALEIRAKIKAVTGLNASAGISYNKFLAKMASDLNKPNGQAVITPKNGPGFVEALAVKKFHGVGPATAERMKRHGIETGLDLKSKSLGFLQQHFGKSGPYFYNIARGIDERQVRPDRIRKSVGAEDTFVEDIDDLALAKAELGPLAQKVWRYCEAHDITAKTVTVKIKYSDFSQATRSKTVSGAVSDLATIQEIAETLLTSAFPFKRPVRLLGITLSSLNTEESEEEPQLALGL